MFTVTVERAAGADQHGNPLPAATHTVDHCWTAPAGSTEQHGLEVTVEWDLDLFAPAGADFAAQDVVLIPDDAIRYQVHGRPERWLAPTGWAAGTVARLKGVAG